MPCGEENKSIRVNIKVRETLLDLIDLLYHSTGNRRLTWQTFIMLTRKVDKIILCENHSALIQTTCPELHYIYITFIDVAEKEPCWLS